MRAEIVTSRLAEFFGMDPFTFVDYAGGDWHAVDGERLRGDKHEPLRWYGCGHPLVALLGIGDDYVTVAVPEYFPGGLAGPPTLDGRSPVDVSLRGARALSRLKARLAAARDITRQDWDFCIGCHAYGPVARWGDFEMPPYCLGCLYTYRGMIID